MHIAGGKRELERVSNVVEQSAVVRGGAVEQRQGGFYGGDQFGVSKPGEIIQPYRDRWSVCDLIFDEYARVRIAIAIMDAGKRAELSETIGAALQVVFRNRGTGLETRGPRDLIGMESG